MAEVLFLSCLSGVACSLQGKMKNDRFFVPLLSFDDGMILLQRFRLSLRRNPVGCQLEKQKVIPL
jgi:hypothetical protein